MHRPLFTKRSRSRLMRGFGVIALLAMFAMNIPVKLATAAQLTTVRDYLSRQQAGVTTGIQHEVFFTTATAVSGGAGANKVILVFPNDAANNTKWCRTAGTLTPTGITGPTPGIVTAESATSLPGTLAGSCTQTPDTFTITGVNNLSSATKYGVRFVGNTGVLGTGDAGNNIKVIVKTNNGSSDIDTYTMATSLIASDQISVTATVDPTLSVTLSGTSIALGTLSPTLINYQGLTSTVTTNAKNGYVSVASSTAATMSDGTDTIAGAGGTVTAGTSGYGISSSDSGSSAQVATSNASPTCDGTQRTQSGSANATSLDTNGKEFAANTVPVSAEATTLCFLAAISATQAPGAYTSTVTLVTTARF